MRVLLIIWLAVGLAPGLGEVAETVVHFATSGHLAHSAADHGDLGDQGHEHGCGTTQHHCGCCASQVVAAATVSVVVGSTVAAPGLVTSNPDLAPLHEPSPLQRPPIFLVA